MPSSRLRLAAATALAAALIPAAAARADDALPEHVPGEVVVTYAHDATTATRTRVRHRTGLATGRAVTGRTRVLHIRDGQTVAHTVAELRGEPGVAAAAPNAIAHAAEYVPSDPGRTGRPKGWEALQWNFAGPYGVDAPDAWSNLDDAGRPGGKGVTVAVLDTGIAYENRGRYRRSPDFHSSHFVAPHDFVDRDRHPDDANGHGTHVAGTINEATGNRIALTGLAYGAKVMPVRVLDKYGDGDSATISKGLRYAVRHGADVVNLSFEFDAGTSTRDVPDLLSALAYAHRKGVLVVGASGNEGDARIAFPARADSVLSVGATTEHGCEARYSNSGAHLDLVAPGGGSDSSLRDDPKCRPSEASGRSIYQLTFTRSVRTFGLPGDYVGTSMAAPHVSAAAALVIASGVLGDHPTPAEVERRLKETARPMGPRRHYGAGLIDAAAATAP